MTRLNLYPGQVITLTDWQGETYTIEIDTVEGDTITVTPESELALVKHSPIFANSFQLPPGWDTPTPPAAENTD